MAETSEGNENDESEQAKKKGMYDDDYKFRDRLGRVIPPCLRPHCTVNYHANGGRYYETQNERRRRRRRWS